MGRHLKNLKKKKNPKHPRSVGQCWDNYPVLHGPWCNGLCLFALKTQLSFSFTHMQIISIAWWWSSCHLCSANGRTCSLTFRLLTLGPKTYLETAWCVLKMFWVRVRFCSSLCGLLRDVFFLSLIHVTLQASCKSRWPPKAGWIILHNLGLRRCMGKLVVSMKTNFLWPIVPIILWPANYRCLSLFLEALDCHSIKNSWVVECP